MKTIEQHFADWESHFIGYGYGTGEEHTMKALKLFLMAAPDEGCYDHGKLEDAVTPPVAWLLISILARAGIIEYGTSPRFGWLTKPGVALREFVSERTTEELIACSDNDEDECYPDHCNCGDEDCRPSNPFWCRVY